MNKMRKAGPPNDAGADAHRGSGGTHGIGAVTR